MAPGRTGTETLTSDQALWPQAEHGEKHQQHQTKLCGPRQNMERNINNIRPSSVAPGRTGRETSTTSDQALLPQVEKHQQHQTKPCGPRQRNNNIRQSPVAPDNNINNIRPSPAAPGRTGRETSTTSDQALRPQAGQEQKHQQHQTKPCGPRQDRNRNINNIRPSPAAPGRTGTETSTTSDQALRPQAGQEEKHQQPQTKPCGPRQDRNRNINNIRPSPAAPGRTGRETSTTSDQALRPQAGQEEKHQQPQTKPCGPRQDRNRNINNIRPSPAAPGRKTSTTSDQALRPQAGQEEDSFTETSKHPQEEEEALMRLKDCATYCCSCSWTPCAHLSPSSWSLGRCRRSTACPPWSAARTWPAVCQSGLMCDWTGRTQSPARPHPPESPADTGPFCYNNATNWQCCPASF